MPVLVLQWTVAFSSRIAISHHDPPKMNGEIISAKVKVLRTLPVLRALLIQLAEIPYEQKTGPQLRTASYATVLLKVF